MKLRQNQKPTVKTTSSIVLKYAAVGVLTIALIFSAVFVYNNFINIGDTKAESTGEAMDGGGFALYLDGDGDYVALPSPMDNMGGLEQLTIEAWVNTSSAAGGKGAKVMPILDFDGEEYFSLYVDGKNGKVSFVTTGQDGSLNDIKSEARVNDNGWHHVAAVYDGNDKVLYIDGKETVRASNAHGGKALGTGDTRYGFIGAQSKASEFDGDKGDGYFTGSIDEVRVWTTARPVEEIRRTLTEKISSDQSGLYLHYSFNEGDGSETMDAVSEMAATLTGDTPATGWSASGIYMGDQSIYDYNNSSLTFSIPGKGAVTVDVTAGTAEGIHIYFVGESPSYVTVPDGIQSLEGFYWGVYVMGDVEYTFSYDYGLYEGELDPELLELAERPNSASDWVHGDALKMAGQSHMVIPNQTGTEYILASSSATVMPIELQSFDAKVKDSGVEVKWTTSSELNNDFFTIERSGNGKDYEIAGKINGAGNSDEPLDYSFTDNSPLSGRSYYRLKQTDYDGKFEYFAPVLVEYTNIATENVQLTVYPNPSLNQIITVTVEGMRDGQEAQVAMMDMQGNPVFRERASSNDMGAFEVKIDPGSMSGGNYLIVVTTPNDKYTKQLILRK